MPASACTCHAVLTSACAHATFDWRFSHCGRRTCGSKWVSNGSASGAGPPPSHARTSGVWASYLCDSECGRTQTSVDHDPSHLADCGRLSAGVVGARRDCEWSVKPLASARWARTHDAENRVVYARRDVRGTCDVPACHAGGHVRAEVGRDVRSADTAYHHPRASSVARGPGRHFPRSVKRAVAEDSKKGIAVGAKEPRVDSNTPRRRNEPTVDALGGNAPVRMHQRRRDAPSRSLPYPRGRRQAPVRGMHPELCTRGSECSCGLHIGSLPCVGNLPRGERRRGLAGACTCRLHAAPRPCSCVLHAGARPPGLACSCGLHAGAHPGVGNLPRRNRW